MKFVLSLTILGFLVLSCKKTEHTPVSTSDSTVVGDSMATTTMPSDTVSAIDSTSGRRITTSDTIKSTK